MTKFTLKTSARAVPMLANILTLLLSDWLPLLLLAPPPPLLWLVPLPLWFLCITFCDYFPGHPVLGCCSHPLLLLSQFSCVRLCATPQTAAHQASPSLGFSRQEHWSGLPFPSPMRESEVAQSCLTLSDPMDCSLPGSSAHGIFQARALEWGAIACSHPHCSINICWVINCKG